MKRKIKIHRRKTKEVAYAIAVYLWDIALGTFIVWGPIALVIFSGCMFWLLGW